ncbi:MAG: N-acetylglucosamine-6-phosphate deacetylase, partial [Chitinophagaceae bacterium]
MKKKFKIINGNIITESAILSNGTVFIEDEKIIGIEKTNIPTSDFEEIDAKGNYVSPGFIDIHVHGGGGHDFMDETEEAFLHVAALHAKFGTTSLLATTLTADKEGILKP